MMPVSFGSIAVDHCDFCGGTFFDQNEINRITIENALTLSKQKENDSITGNEKCCPKDSFVLKPLQMESVPQHVVLLQCDTCRGIFAYGDDLVAFKTAQEAKLHYYTSWRRPMPSLANVLVFSFILAISVSVAYRISPYFGTPPIPTQATDELCPIELIDTDSATTIYCKSPRPYTSEALFYNQVTGEKLSRTINKEPSLVHILTVDKTDIAQSSDVCVQLSLTDAQGTRDTPCVTFFTAN